MMNQSMRGKNGRENHGHMLRLPAMALRSLPSVALSSKQVLEMVIKFMKIVNNQYSKNPMTILSCCEGR